MHMTDMIATVQKRADLSSVQAANDTLITVAQVLSERDLNGEQHNFAAQLPADLKTIMTQTASSTEESLNAEEFVDRVGQRLELTAPDARARTHAALSVMLESVSEGERVDVLNAPPDDFTPYAVWRA